MSDEDSDLNFCPICFESYSDTKDQEIMCSECGNRFHISCAKMWFNISKSEDCPLCRQ